MARFVEERNANFIDEFKAAVPCFWGVSEQYHHRGEMRNCDMYRNAAAIRGYGDNLMTGECSKIRSGEFLVFRSCCRCACVWVWLFMCPSKKLFSSSICVCPGPKGAYIYSYSLSGEYMLSNFRMHGVIMLVEIIL